MGNRGPQKTQVGKCSVEGCEKTKWAKGFCTAHYKRQQRGKSMDGPAQQYGELVTLFSVRTRPEIADALTAMSVNRGGKEKGVTPYLFIQKMLEDWFEKEGRAELKAYEARVQEGQRELLKYELMKTAITVLDDGTYAVAVPVPGFPDKLVGYAAAEGQAQTLFNQMLKHADAEARRRKTAQTG